MEKLPPLTAEVLVRVGFQFASGEPLISVLVKYTVPQRGYPAPAAPIENRAPLPTGTPRSSPAMAG